MKMEMNNQLQSALKEAEQALQNDPLQEAVLKHQQDGQFTSSTTHPEGDPLDGMEMK